MVRKIACLLAVAIAPFIALSHARAAVSIENPASAAPICVLRGPSMPVTLLVSLQSTPALGGTASTLSFVVATSDGPQTFVVPAGRNLGVVFLPLSNLGSGCLILLQSSVGNQGSATVTIESAPLFSVPLPAP